MNFSIKQVANLILKSVGIKRIFSRSRELVPYNRGYYQARNQLIREAINNESLLNVFGKGESLPEKFGVGFDERCVEYPWLLAHLPASPQYILDAGSVLNHDFILSHTLFENKKLHILTLAPEGNCFWKKKVSYLYDDLRDIPIVSNYYDTIVCLSTLEHVGCDNSFFTTDVTYQENRPEDFVLVMKELYRLLKPGGSLFLSVPYGIYRYFGSFQQFDRQLLSQAIDSFGEVSEVIETFYRYTEQGWQVSTAENCANCEYVEWIVARGWREQPGDNIPVEPDLAAAARAVACVHLVKRQP